MFHKANPQIADLIVHSAKVTTFDAQQPFEQAVAVRDGRFVAVGTTDAIMKWRGPNTTVIDARGRTMIPGLIDSHLHLIRGALSYNLELRWDGVPSLADAMRMLKEQARRTPPGQWVRDLPPALEGELTAVVRLLAEKRWPFRLHAKYDESITRFLNVFETVNRDVPFDGLRWFFDHAETVSEQNLDRIKALGGIAVQHRMAFQGEYFIERDGSEAVRHSPPIRSMLSRNIPVGAGTDGTRVASYNPFVSLYWLVSGKTVGGTPMYGDDNRMDRLGALKLYSAGSAWFSGDDDSKGSIKVGQLADFAVLTADYFSVPEDEIKRLESVLTVLAGKIVYAVEEFSAHGPAPLPVLQEWAPVAHYGGYQNAPAAPPHQVHHVGCSHMHRPQKLEPLLDGFWGSGCSCWAF